MSAIKIKNVSYSYPVNEDEYVDAIKNISLNIEEGSFVALVGHNGSGKSTLAKLLNGLIVPDEGNVTIFGIDTQDEDNIYEIRKNVLKYRTGK